jgi:carbonic anhydrase
MDFRTTEKLFRWMKKRDYIGNCDMLLWPGASKKLVESEASRQAALADIELAVHKHGVHNIMIMHHSNCGAYQIEDTEKEKEAQLADMREARHIIQQHFADVSLGVELIWVKLKPKKQKNGFKLKIRSVKLIKEAKKVA